MKILINVGRRAAEADVRARVRSREANEERVEVARRCGALRRIAL
jgi:hypothetical protein